MDEDRKREFEAAKQKIIGTERERPVIGTLGEKSVHAVLKYFYAPNEDNHEIPIEKFVADIYKDGEIIEIQSKAFYRLRDKLSCFLDKYPVTVVYPIAREKYISWINDDTGEISERRKSSKKGKIYDALHELYTIKSFLKEPYLKITLCIIDMEEYRILDGYGENKKNHATKFDRIPIALVDEITLSCPEDYMLFVPYDLPEVFTVKDFAKSAKINTALAGRAVNVLHYTGVLEKVGTEKRAYLYRVRE
ncbi:MAG: hypothetical protein IJ608_03605 [Lachnospiraceae bacterium]|nr:hypothetical protein [Lachnospiraceae bacterium]